MSNSRSSCRTCQATPGLKIDITDYLVKIGDVTPTGAAILRTVNRMNSRGMFCFVRNETLARALGVATKTVANNIVFLVAAGFLLRGTYRGRRSLHVNTCVFKQVLLKQESDSRLREPVKKTEVQDPERSPERFRARASPPVDPADPHNVGPGLDRCQPKLPAPADAGAMPTIAGKGVSTVDGLFGPREPKAGPKKPEITADDQRRADQLREAVRVHTKAPPESLAKTDAAELGILRRKLKDDAQLDAVLSWYCEHISDRYTPKALTGAWFRSKYHSIVAAKDRAEERALPSPRGGSATPDPEPDPEAESIARKLTSAAVWPLGSAPQVAPLARRALTDVRSFQRILSNIAKHGNESPLTADHARAATRLLQHMGPAEYVVESWFTQVLERVSRWDGWSGRLDFFAWRPDHPDAVGGIRCGLDWADSMYDDHWVDLMSCFRGWSCD